MCVHLRMIQEGECIVYVKWYLGKGLDTDFMCHDCTKARESGAAVAVEPVCQECFERIALEDCEAGSIRGKPEIRERLLPMNTVLQRSPLPRDLGTIVDIAPIEGEGESLWILLAEDGGISRFDAVTGDWKRLASASVPSEPDTAWNGHHLRPRLHASPRGDFAAVVNDYGRYGQVIDLGSGMVTSHLDGGDSSQCTVPFSFAFAEVHGRPVAIHRTAWNRLDLSDAATGKVISGRGPTSYSQGEARPKRYLDYFHGALHLSPGGQIADDGWVWHPWGAVSTWSLEAWLSNPWESENGLTLKCLCSRAYYWDSGMAWLNDHVLAVGGIGEDDDVIVDGARIFEIDQKGEALEAHTFAGPAGVFFSDGASLFSSDGMGLSRWDPSEGTRTGHFSGFQPTHHHRRAGELAEVRDGALLRWKIG